MCPRLLLLISGVLMAAPGWPEFRQRTVATGLKGGYQVLAVDMNSDGKPDLIALASDLPDLVWYENPGWERHVIATGLRRMINAAAWDWDGDGIPEIVLAQEFSPNPQTSVGIVSVLRHQDDPRNPWSITEIDRLPTSHRLRLADIQGSGKKVVVNAPLAGASAVPPEYRGHVPLVYYRPPEWKRRLITDSTEGVMHGIQVVDWDGDGRDEILTASMQGLHLVRLAPDGRWTRTLLTPADPSPWPKSGASDVAVGHLGKRRFLCTIEPWHGHQVAVYLEGKDGWKRNVIEDTLADGHALLAVDLNGDGRDEIVAGFRGKGRRVYIYRAEDLGGKRWVRATLDDGDMAAASCAVAGRNAGGLPNLVCIGTATENLKLYENLGAAK